MLLGVGVRPNVQLAVDAGLALGASGGIATDDYMRTSDPDIYAVGDAAEYVYAPTGARMRVALAGPANRTGRLAGEHAATGASRPAPASWARRSCGSSATPRASPGCRCGPRARPGSTRGPCTSWPTTTRATFPGAEPMVLKLVYEDGTGRVLGVQAVGGAGVDKRLDVIATLMYFRGTVHDLAELDLAYAPPFGSAKDPLHMAAFAAENDLDGLARVIQPDADLSGYQVVDVREPREVAVHAARGRAPRQAHPARRAPRPSRRA